MKIEDNPDLKEDRYIEKEMLYCGEYKRCILDTHTNGKMIVSVHNLDEDLTDKLSKLNQEYHDHVLNFLKSREKKIVG